MAKIVDVCMVAPSPASSQSTSDTPKSLPLTFFDIRWLRLPPVQRLFFYEISTPNTNTNTSTSFFLSNVLPRLKQSLSLTLRHYLPLAGNLTWPESSHKPAINCTEGDAVMLTVAESSADFYLLSGTGTNEFFEAAAYHHLIPNLAVSHDRAAALALQITVFTKNSCGFCIGIATHHAVADGQTSTSFMISWAHMCRSLGGNKNQHAEIKSLPTELKPVYDRTTIKDPAGLEVIFTNQWLALDGGPNNRSLMSWEVKQVPSDSVRGNFHLTRANIEKLRQVVNKRDDQKVVNHVSTFSLACSYTMVCLAKAEGITGEKVMIAFSVDFRSRLEPPIPATYFGNCIGSKVVFKETKDLVGEDGLISAVTSIGEAIKSLKNSSNGALDGAENWVTELTSLQGTSRVYSTAGSPRFEVYSTDFGWGRPRKVDVVSIDKTGAIGLSESRDGDGIEIGVVLKKHHMEVFATLFSQALDS